MDANPNLPTHHFVYSRIWGELMLAKANWLANIA